MYVDADRIALPHAPSVLDVQHTSAALLRGDCALHFVNLVAMSAEDTGSQAKLHPWRMPQPFCNTTEVLEK
jgi:hypothetical protein